MVVAGIDYSLTSPAICIHSGEEWDYSNCKFYYMVGNEKKITEAPNYFCTVYPQWSEDCERFNNLADIRFILHSARLLKRSQFSLH